MHAPVALAAWMVFTKLMVRKQIYITEQQEQALESRAQVLGVSEAELVRQAVDELVRDTCGHSRLHRDALGHLLDNTRCLAEHHRLPEGSCFGREDLYVEREGRWTDPPMRSV